MTRWETYHLLCQCLAHFCARDIPGLKLDTADWPRLIEASSHHLVTPALAWCVAENETTPPDVKEYLQAVLVLNAQRNNTLLDVLESIVRAFNAVEITPVLLKGVAALVEPLYPHIGVRTLRDLDLLIPGARSREALECARAVGFVDAGLSVWVEGESHHLPAHVHSATGAALELHLRVVPPRYTALLSTDDVFRNAMPASFRGAAVLMPSPTDRVAHNIVHSQIVDGLHLRGIVALRDLLDLAMLGARHEAAIDWPALEHRFGALGYLPVLNRTVSLAQALFSHPKFIIAGPVSAKALQRLERAIEQRRRQRWGLLALLMRRHVHGIRTTPREFLNLFNPWSWPRRVRTIRKVLATPKW